MQALPERHPLSRLQGHKADGTFDHFIGGHQALPIQLQEVLVVLNLLLLCHLGRENSQCQQEGPVGGALRLHLLLGILTPMGLCPGLSTPPQQLCAEGIPQGCRDSERASQSSGQGREGTSPACFALQLLWAASLSPRDGYSLGVS